MEIGYFLRVKMLLKKKRIYTYNNYQILRIKKIMLGGVWIKKLLGWGDLCI